jgi:hypothetical protein
VFSNVTDHRVAVMTGIETYLDRILSASASGLGAGASVGAGGGPRAATLERTVAGFGESVERLEVAVSRFESALQAFSTSTRDFTEFNAHLKDNVQRMSLSFGDLGETLKSHLVALKRGNGQ